MVCRSYKKWKQMKQADGSAKIAFYQFLDLMWIEDSLIFVLYLLVR
jgi:hypothetical protein